MKTFPSFRGTAALAMALGCLATSALSAELSKPVSPVAISFRDPDTFSDSKLGNGGDPYRESVFSAVRIFLTSEAAPLLPEGYTLSVDFTDIDFGHRTAHRQALIGAPDFEFTYQVTNAAGAVVRHGSESLKNYTDFGNYQYSVATTDLTTEIIQPEKPMLKNWAVSALAGLK